MPRPRSLPSCLPGTSASGSGTMAAEWRRTDINFAETPRQRYDYFGRNVHIFGRNVHEIRDVSAHGHAITISLSSVPGIMSRSSSLADSNL